jgi:hypothetical protein
MDDAPPQPDPDHGVLTFYMRLRITILSALALAAVLSTLLVAGPGASVAQAKPVIGLADQNFATLVDPRYQAAKLKYLRVNIPYDRIRRGGKGLQAQDAFLNTAHSQGKDVLVSFYRTTSCSPRCAAKRLPTVKEFQADFRRFRARYPWVKKFSTWNEENFPKAQPTGRNPKRAGQFYLMLRKECRGGKCSVLTGDFRANGSKFDKQWFKKFRKTIGGGSHSWGLITYPDLNKFQTKYTRQFLKNTRRGNVYITEVGAFNIYTPFYRANLSRQNRAMKYLMTKSWKVSRRIKAMYVYSWRANKANKSFDSALINANGSTRPAYSTFLKYLKGFRH